MSEYTTDARTGERSPVAGNPPEPARRGFLNMLLWGWAAALAASIFYPIARYLVPPKISEATTNQVTLPFKVSGVKPNSGTIFKFGRKPGLLVRTEQGEFKAFSAICTHLDCTVQYRDDAQQIWCACHNGLYDLRGRNVSGPPPRPLEELQVHLKGDEIVVSKMG
jgi:Rieske Fe-S protein